jgi:hypothetical protein
MTEVEWLSCIDPSAMLHYLDGMGKARDRKLRLLACACCRRIWDLIEGELHRRAIEVAEQFADGPGSVIEWADSGGVVFRELRRGPAEGRMAEEREAALRELENERNSLDPTEVLYRYDHLTPEDTAMYTLFIQYQLHWSVVNFAAQLRAAPESYWKRYESPTLTPEEERRWEAGRQVESNAQTHLLRDIIGNPFHPAPVIDPAWLTRNNGLVKRLAEAAYQERSLPDGTLDVARLAVLADALTDVGCTDPDLLEHLQGPGPHTRGCFVLDLLTGRE